MRIALLTPEHVTEEFSGGLANYVHRTSSALAARGHDVHVFALSRLENDDVVRAGVTIHRIALGRTSRWLKRISGGRLEEAADWLDFMIRAYRRIVSVHREVRFDVMQVPNYTACGLVALTFLPVPSTVRLSSYEPEWNDLAGVEKSTDRTIREWLDWLQLRLATHLYAPSESLRRLVQAKSGISGIELVPTPFMLEDVPLDTSVFDRHLTGKKYLLFFGRFQLHKGFHILARAMPRILEANPDCVAAFIGMDLPSQLARSMREYAANICRAFPDRLIFHDQIPHSQLYPVIARAHLVVLPSLIDNLPNACLEAMALGKAVIGTERTSFEEMVTDGVTGFLVSPGDAEALAATVNAVWRREDLQAVGNAARDSVRRFHPDVTMPLLEAHFRSIIDQHYNAAETAPSPENRSPSEMSIPFDLRSATNEDLFEWRDRIVRDALAHMQRSEVQNAVEALRQLELATIDGKTLQMTDPLLPRIADGRKVVAAFDPGRTPHLDEVVIIYGNYPHMFENVVIHNPIKRHVTDFWSFRHDRVEADPRWEGVDHIFVINADERRDRLDSVLRELCSAKAPLDRVTRLAALKGDSGAVGGVSGMIGCLRSHIDVLKQARAARFDDVLVLEDDFCFTSDLERHLTDLRTFFERRYEYWVCLVATSKYGPIVPKDDLVSLSFQHATNTGGYLVSRDGLEHLLPVFEHALERLRATGDLAYAADICWGQLQPSDKFMVFRRKFGFQVSSFSDIEGKVSRYLD